MSKQATSTDKATHTPGPWLQSSTVLVCNSDARVIANCTPLVDVPELAIPMNEVDANARLIAAAPDLLDYLERVVENARHSFQSGIPYDRPALLAGAARIIAKVKGE